MKMLCTICARGGSKGVLGKNIRLLLGKPLIAHSIERARESGMFDHIAVSSDSEEILEVAQEAGADQLVRRPRALATDEAAKLPVIRHCALEVEATLGKVFEVFVDLDSTSPLRSIGDIERAVALLQNTGAENVITAMPARRSPYFNLVELNEKGVAVLSKPPSVEVSRRQASPACFDMNASIYVWRREALLEGPDTVFLPSTRLLVMPEERSIDIDSELDFRFVEFLARQRAGNQG
jgi:N-acylneuraminate cytidylyltransferase/CMP-N,N'-diacetyllegionaminic acid synthase